LSVFKALLGLWPELKRFTGRRVVFCAFILWSFPDSRKDKRVEGIQGTLLNIKIDFTQGKLIGEMMSKDNNQEYELIEKVIWSCFVP